VHAGLIFPLNLDELSILIAVTAIVLLVTSELISPYHRRVRIYLSRKRLRQAAVVFSIAFLVIVGVKIYQIIISAI
jgi:uncharacterized membrane protein